MHFALDITNNDLFLFCYLSPMFYSESVCKFNVPHESFTRVLLTGLTFGLLTAVITKFTSGVRVLEPLALLGGSYLAYVVAELFHWYVVTFVLHFYHANQFFCIPTTCLEKVQDHCKPLFSQKSNKFVFDIKD